MNTIVFIDGQNLFHGAKSAWGTAHSPATRIYYPSYDVEKLAQALVARFPHWTLGEVRFYTGVPHSAMGPSEKYWYGFWMNKLRYMRSRGIYVYRGHINSGGQEKGVDVSLALDLVQATHERRYEAAIIVSQDSDFGPAVRLAKQVAKDQGRVLEFASAFPVGPGTTYRRGIPGTHWVPIDQATYDACLDPRDYRPRPQ